MPFPPSFSSAPAGYSTGGRASSLPRFGGRIAGGSSLDLGAVDLVLRRSRSRGSVGGSLRGAPASTSASANAGSTRRGACLSALTTAGTIASSRRPQVQSAGSLGRGESVCCPFIFIFVSFLIEFLIPLLPPLIFCQLNLDKLPSKMHAPPERFRARDPQRRSPSKTSA